MNGPENMEHVGAYVDPMLRKLVAAQAIREDRSVSEIIRLALRRYVNDTATGKRPAMNSQGAQRPSSSRPTTRAAVDA